MSDLIPVSSPGVPVYVGMQGGPLVVLVHDYFGRLPGLLSIADLLAREGFFVAVPDLFNGVATRSAVDAEALMNDLDVGIALAELDDIISDSRSSGSQKIGVVGFSMGGWLSLLHAQGGGADAVAAYYSSLGPADHGVLPAPVLLHYAESDEWGEGEDPVSFIERLHEHGTPVTDHVYLGTEHSFANSEIDATYNARAAQLANQRTVRFLLTHLFVR
ncbi:MAG TPA: dienelactone hydrolase family protein [Galbitalea sp.]